MHYCNVPLILFDPSFPYHTSAESDCACPTAGVRGVPPISEIDYREEYVTSEFYTYPHKFRLPSANSATAPSLGIRAHTDQNIHHYSLLFSPLGQGRPALLNQSALDLLAQFKKPTTLNNILSKFDNHPVFSETARTLVDLQLLEPIVKARNQRPQQPHTLVAWLHITNACNLRCTYCYLHKSEESMDVATGIEAIQAIFRSAQKNGYTSVKLKYAGGESTLNFGLIQVLHGQAQSLADRLKLGLSEVVLSNGIALTTPMLTFIKQHNIRLMISLDGLNHYNDSQRFFVNGSGTSSHILSGIERSLQHGILPHLSITVTANSAEGLPDVVAFALDNQLPFNLNFYRANNASQKRTELQAEDQQLIDSIHRAFSVIERTLPAQSIIPTLVDRANFSAPHEHPCGAGHSYMVIDQAGAVARCQMEIERSITDIFAEDPLIAIHTYNEGFQNVSVDQKEGCRECAWRYWCAGGCPSLTYRVTGRSDIQSPYCHVYQAIFPELLRLEGLRLLKYYQPFAV